MAGALLTYSFESSDLQRLEIGLGDTAPLLAQIGEYLQDSTKDRFKVQAGPDGTPWAPLQPRYQRRKKKNKDKILTLQGYLRGYIHWQPDGTDAVQVGTNQKYGAVHQHGATMDMPARQATVHFGAGKAKHLFVKKARAASSRQVSIGAHQVNIPARPYLGVSAADQTEIRTIVLDWLKRL